MEVGANNSVVECYLAKVEVMGSSPIWRSQPSLGSTDPCVFLAFKLGNPPKFLDDYAICNRPHIPAYKKS
jgi:hypothetical protein